MNGILCYKTFASLKQNGFPRFFRKLFIAILVVKKASFIIIQQNIGFCKLDVVLN